MDIDVGDHNGIVSNSPDERQTTPNIAVIPTKLRESDISNYAVNSSPLPAPPKEHHSVVSVDAPHDSDEEPDSSASPRSVTQDEESFGDERVRAASAQPSKDNKGKARAVDLSDAV